MKNFLQLIFIIAAWDARAQSDRVTSSFMFKQINTRGKNTTGNGRFLQLVDGMDNRSAGLGFIINQMQEGHPVA